MAFNVTRGASFSNADAGQLIMGVRTPTADLFSTSGTNLYQPFVFDTQGNLRTSVQFQSGGAGSNVVVTSASNIQSVVIVADDVGIGGGIQFGEGTTSTNITGTAIMAVGSDDVMQSLQGDPSKYLLVNIGSQNNIVTTSSVNGEIIVNSVSNIIHVTGGNFGVDINADNVGIGGGIQFGDGTTSTNITGTAIMIERSDNTLHPMQADDNNYTLVNLGSQSNIVTTSPVNSTIIVSSASNILHITGGNFGVDINADNVGIGGGIQFGDGTTSTNVTGTAIMTIGADNVMEPLQGDGNKYLFVNLGSQSNLVTTSSVNGTIIISSASNLIHITGGNFGVDINADNVGIGGGIQFGDGQTSTNITGTVLMAMGSDNVVEPAQVDESNYIFVNLGSVSNLLTTSSVNSETIVSSASNLITVSAINSEFVVSSASNVIAVSNTNNTIIATLPANSGTNIGLVDIDTIGPGNNNIGNVDVVTASNLLGVILETAGNIVTTSSTNPDIQSITATSLDGTFVTAPYTTDSGYFSTTINISTSVSNKLIQRPAEGQIFITHIKASAETHANYVLKEDSSGTPLLLWGTTYLTSFGGENATLTVPITTSATKKDLALSASCTNFSVTIVGYIK